MNQYQEQQNNEYSYHQQNLSDNNDKFNTGTKLFQNARLNFIKKVLGIVSVQILLFAITITIAQVSQSAKLFFVQHEQYNLIFSVGSILSAILIKFFSQQVPINYALLGLFTMCTSYTTASYSLMFPQQVVVQAAILTTLITISLTIYAFNCKKDFTKMGASLFMLVSSMLFWSLLNIYFQYKFIDTILTLGGVVVYGFYLIFDVQLLSARSKSISLDDYILGALNIYIDIVQLFIKILKLINDANSQEKNNNKRK